MQPTKFNILSTRPVAATSIDAAAVAGIKIDVRSFIETTPIATATVVEDIQQTICSNATIIFTSMNAVEAVADHLNSKSLDWKIYCLGSTTKELCEQYFGAASIIGTASHATALAELIVENGVSGSLIFFCGDRRRDELPDILRKHHLSLKEIIVYETNSIHPTLEKNYDGILFFSPSAVESFFNSTRRVDGVVMFAIGKTTASAIRNYTDQKIIISDHPGKEHLVQKSITYFSTLS